MASARSSSKRKCTKCGTTRVASQFAGDSARVCNPCKRAGARANARARHLDDTYGISTEESEDILKAQHGKCAGCGGTRRYELHVDHDHKLQAKLLAEGCSPREAARRSVRGRLCARCNKVLRDVRDNAPALVRLAAYLHDPPAQKVLQ